MKTIKPKIDLNLPNKSGQLIWLDTSTIINIYKYQSGNLDLEKSRSIVNLIDHIKKNNLSVPFADQREEIWRDRKQFLETALQISKGVKARYLESIKDIQVNKAMKAFFLSENQIDLSMADYIQEIDDSPILLHTDINFSTLLRQPSSLIEKLEELRLRLNGKFDFESQFLYELRGEFDAIKKHIGNAREKETMGIPLNLNEQEAIYYIEEIIHNCSLYNKSLEDYVQFVNSPYYESIPFFRISALIITQILKTDRKIQSGDIMDINHAASTMPYVDYFLTDRFMKSTIIRLGLHKEYKTEVLSIRDFQ